MSDGKNNDIQDYLDLLDEYKDNYTDEGEKTSEGELSENPKKITTPPFEKKGEKKDKNPFKRLSKWFNNLSKKKKILVSVIAIILTIVLIITTFLGIFVIQKLSLLGDNSDNDDDIIYSEEQIGDIEIDIGSEGFKQSLIDWATTGNDKHMRSKNVVNVLLIGADSRYGRNEGNTDVMMLVSVNRKTKQLNLVSFLRDSYLYVEGKGASYCTKLNAAYSMGGPECLIQTIENNYKIDIDNYVMVNFESFKSIVDAMDGITVDVQAYEANYILSKYHIQMPIGDNVKLNGEQALIFCRVRGCDSDGDVSRTRRQRQVIDSMVNRVISSSISEINKYIDIFLPYVDTGYSESQILSLGIKAITGGWAKYERNQISVPSEDCRTSGSANMWIWVVDYQKAAHDLQMEIYGESNITLPDDRITIIDVYNGASYNGNSSDISDNNTADEPEVPETTQSVTYYKDNSSDNVITTAVPTTRNNVKEENKPKPTDEPTVPDIIDDTDPPETEAPVTTEPTSPAELPDETQGGEQSSEVVDDE